MPSPTLNRVLWTVLIILLATLVWQTRKNLDFYYAGIGALDVRADAANGTLYLNWRGRIDAPMEARLKDAFERYRDQSRRVVLTLSSPGGSLDHGAKVVRLLGKISQSHHLETAVSAGRRCASMCVPIYLQGQSRTAAAGARFMFHEVFFRSALSDVEPGVLAKATDAETTRMFDTYYKPAGVPDAWIARVRAGMAGDKDVWKTAAELVDEKAGIVQEIRD